MSVTQSATRLAQRYEQQHGIAATYEAQDTATVPDLVTGVLSTGVTQTAVTVVPGPLTVEEQILVQQHGWTGDIQRYHVRTSVLPVADANDVLIVGGNRRQILQAQKDALGVRWGLLTQG